MSSGVLSSPKAHRACRSRSTPHSRLRIVVGKATILNQLDSALSKLVSRDKAKLWRCASDADM
jgi:hypothetical protein